MARLGRPPGSRNLKSHGISLRNLEILNRRLAGEKLESIAEDYAVTRERIRQIVNSVIGTFHAERRYAAFAKIKSYKHKLSETQEATRERLAVKSELKELFSREFNRAKAMRIASLSDNAMTDLELCRVLREKFKISFFFDYIWCTKCNTPKPKQDFAIGVQRNARTHTKICRPCNTARCKEIRHRVGSRYTQRLMAYQRQHPNLQKIYQLRHYFKKTGFPEKMPALPPAGTPDDQIVLPPKIPFDCGLPLRVWHAQQKTGMGAAAALKLQKAKELVDAELRSRKP